MGAPAAVASAVNDALQPTGAPVISSLPIKPSDVWEALRAGRAAPPLQPHMKEGGSR
jgi:hypothetical protein